jgi:hypothetical protein
VISSSQRPLPDSTQLSQHTDIHAPDGFEPTISAGERPQTYTLDGTATGTGGGRNSISYIYIYSKFFIKISQENITYYFLLHFGLIWVGNLFSSEKHYVKRDLATYWNDIEMKCFELLLFEKACLLRKTPTILRKALQETIRMHQIL